MRKRCVKDDAIRTDPETLFLGLIQSIAKKLIGCQSRASSKSPSFASASSLSHSWKSSKFYLLIRKWRSFTFLSFFVLFLSPSLAQSSILFQFLRQFFSVYLFGCFLLLYFSLSFIFLPSNKLPSQFMSISYNVFSCVSLFSFLCQVFQLIFLSQFVTFVHEWLILLSSYFNNCFLLSFLSHSSSCLFYVVIAYFKFFLTPLLSLQRLLALNKVL